MAKVNTQSTKYDPAISVLMTVFGIMLLLAFIPIQTVCYKASLAGFGRYLIDIIFAPYWALYGCVTDSSSIIRFGLSTLGLLLAAAGTILQGLHTSVIRALLNVVLLFGFLFILLLGCFVLGLWLCH